ncbi:MAG: U32 family peptidase [Methanosarcinaceae archaeon]|nr:U32 family peptidase [Methanosarcinaceae archaeon]
MHHESYHAVRKQPEILAPAGDMEALWGALKGGADAVYLGVADFNARQGAANFSLEELEQAIDLAHSRNVRVFLALNIPVKQKELQEVLDIIDRAYSCGVDALIMEDIGLMKLLSSIYPELPLHASTQMTVHNSAGVDLVELAGASRVILSRELSFGQVKDIVDKSNIDIELFAHGALCYSYSGRCLFSSFLSNRSANRGACTQPCRRPYRIMVDGEEISKKLIGEYPLNCAELCTLSELDRIVKTGVRSLKIEGRMKRPEYVTASSMIYKKAVERICRTGSNLGPEEIDAHETELAKLFYRGFTKGFVLGESDVTHRKYSSSYGLFLGRVREISQSKHHAGLHLKLQQDIGSRDGISILTRMKMLGSRVDAILLNGEKVQRASKGDEVVLYISPKTGKAVRPGDEVFLSTDDQLIDSLRKKYLRKLPLDIVVTARAGGRFRLDVSESRASASFTDEYVVQEAKSSPTAAEKIAEAVGKLGDTPYYTGSLTIEADENIFIPLGVITAARREAVSLLEDKVRKLYKRELKKPNMEKQDPGIGGKAASPEKRMLLSVELSDPEAIAIAAKAGADIIYLPIGSFGRLMEHDKKEELLQLKEKGTEFVFITPQVTFDHELEAVKQMMEDVHDAGFTVACSNSGTVRAASLMDMNFTAQRELNIFNSLTAGFYSRAGASRVTMSSELNLDEIKDVSDALVHAQEKCQLELLVHGRELLLITENDLLKPLADRGMLKRNSRVDLIDRRGESFPVRRQGRRTLIYHSKVFNMLEHVQILQENGVDVLLLDLSMNNRNYIEECVRDYRGAIDGRKSKIPLRKDESSTEGHYFEGVL